jgi:hypothetical protein
VTDEILDMELVDPLTDNERVIAAWAAMPVSGEALEERPTVGQLAAQLDCDVRTIQRALKRPRVIEYKRELMAGHISESEIPKLWGATFKEAGKDGKFAFQILRYLAENGFDISIGGLVTKREPEENTRNPIIQLNTTGSFDAAIRVVRTDGVATLPRGDS